MSAFVIGINLASASGGSEEESTRLCGCAAFGPLTRLVVGGSADTEGADELRPPPGEQENIAFAFVKGLCSGFEGRCDGMVEIVITWGTRSRTVVLALWHFLALIFWTSLIPRIYS